MSKVVNIAKQALDRGIKAKSKIFLTPGSEQIRLTIENHGFVCISNLD